MADDPPELIPSVGIVELLVQAAAFVAIAYIAVGLPYWRDLRAATDRLGIVARTCAPSVSPSRRPSPASSWRPSPVSSRSSSIPD